MKRILMVAGMLAALALAAGLAGWTFYAGSRIGDGWTGVSHVLTFVIIGLTAVGALTGGLMWLAFYSARHGYDEPYDVNKPGGGRGPSS
jgi:cation transporter-like permease